MAQNEPSLNDWLFIGEYVKDWKPMAAIKRAGFYHGKYASVEANRRLQKPAVRAEIEKIKQQVVNKVQLNTQMIVDDIVGVLAADPADLIDIIQGACRHCHGDGHLYQRTHSERHRALFEADATGKPFNEMGGSGYDQYADPHPNCPECHGHGETRERIKDVRDMTPAARALYMGAERTKNGLKINMRSKDAAREAAAKFLGMNKETLRVVDGKDMKELSDAELEAMARGESK